MPKTIKIRKDISNGEIPSPRICLKAIMHFAKIIWSKWKHIAHKIGVFQSKVILTIFYFILLLPFGLFISLFKDELGIKSAKKSTWVDKKKQCQTLEEMREMF